MQRQRDEMASNRVTSHDVARRAGVSRATVSLVLNRSESVTLSKETRERVLQAAAVLERGGSPQ